MQTIDIFEFARRRQTLSGTISVADMPQLSAFLADTTGEIRWFAEGLGERRGRPAARLEIEGEVAMPCAFCNGPVPTEVYSDAVFLFVKTEAEADAIPVDEDEEDEEVTVGSNRFSIAAWVEEEAILSLPATTSHDEGCEGTEVFEEKRAAEEAAEERAREDRPNPFAALADLKTGR